MESLIRTQLDQILLGIVAVLNDDIERAKVCADLSVAIAGVIGDSSPRVARIAEAWRLELRSLDPSPDPEPAPIDLSSLPIARPRPNPRRGRALG